MKLKEIFLYLLALVILLAPTVVLGMVGLSLLGWLGCICGIIGGIIIFILNLNKLAGMEGEAEKRPLPGNTYSGVIHQKDSANDQTGKGEGNS